MSATHACVCNHPVQVHTADGCGIERCFCAKYTPPKPPLSPSVARPKLPHPWVTADALRDLAEEHRLLAAMEPGICEAIERLAEWLDLLEPDSRHAGHSTNGDPFGAERKTRP